MPSVADPAALDRTEARRSIIEPDHGVSVFRAAAWAGLTLVAFTFALTRGVNRADEGWFLRVAERVAGGEVLYRDVFFGATPLTAWLGAALVALPGSGIVWLKLLTAVGFTALAWCCDRVLVRLGAAPAARLWACGALLALALPTAIGLAPYTLLANVGAIGCCGLALRVAEQRESASASTAAVAGGTAALAFAAKQTVGAATLLALLATLALVQVGAPRQRARLIATASVGFLAIAALAFAPVLWSGGWAGLLDYGFLGKGAYLRVGGGGVLAELPTWAGSSLTDGERSKAIYLALGALLPPLAVGAVLARLAREGARPEGVTVAAFLVAGITALVPRATFAQMALYAPMCLPALVWGWPWAAGRLAPSARRALAAAALALVAVGVGYTLASPAARLLSPSYAMATVGELRGVWLREGEAREIALHAGELTGAARGQPLLIVSGEAGFWSAVAEVPNPTPFDYPFVTAFGRTGEARVAEAVASGALRAACVDARMPPEMRPARLLAAIARHMAAAEELGVCTVYRRPQDPDRGPRV